MQEIVLAWKMHWTSIIMICTQYKYCVILFHIITNNI